MKFIGLDKFKETIKEIVLEELINAPSNDINLTEEEMRWCLIRMRDKKDLTWLLGDMENGEEFDLDKFKSRCNFRAMMRPRQGAIFADDRSYSELMKAALEQVKSKTLAKKLAKVMQADDPAAREVISLMTRCSGGTSSGSNK